MVERGPFPLGTLLKGRYEVTAVLGHGGMGSAYLATDRDVGRTVVVKAPHARLLAEEGFRERFLREVRSLVGLEHPHVVKMYDAGEEQGVPFAVLQHLAGGSLAERLAAARPSPAEVLAWLAPVAEALDFVHAEGVVHRDVKPANVLFDRAGRAHLADFGIAKALGAADTGITQTGLTPGSPGYMAPEALAEGPVDGAYDQYALGVMAYEALAGQPPHTATNPLRLLALRAAEPPTALEVLAPHLAPATCAAVMRALEREPARRFPSCAAFAAAVRDSLAPPRAARGATQVSTRVAGAHETRARVAERTSDRAPEATGRPWLRALVLLVPLTVAGVVVLPRLFPGRLGSKPSEPTPAFVPPPPVSPAPTPAPAPVRTPEPEPAPVPSPAPSPAPVASPGPSPVPTPGPSPAPSPAVPPAPEPAPGPAVAPTPPPAAPPRVVLEAPAGGSVFTVPEVTVSGTVEGLQPGDRVLVNGEAVALDGSRFTYRLPLDPEQGARLAVSVEGGGAVRLALPERRYRYVRPIPLLLAALRGADADARRRASEDLVRLGSAAAPALPALLALAEAEENATSDAAVTTLAGLGPTALPFLVHHLHQPNQSAGAQRAVVGMGIAAVPALIESFQDESDGIQATAATSPMMALGAIGPPALPLLIEALAPRGRTAADRKRVYYATEALARLLEVHENARRTQAPDLVPPLLGALEVLRRGSTDEHGPFYVYLAIGMLQVSDDRLVEALMSLVRDEHQGLLAPRATSGETATRSDAHEALGALQELGPYALQALPELRRLEARAAAERHPALAGIRAVIAYISEDFTQHVAELEQKLKRAADVNEREAVVAELHHLGLRAADARDTLLALLDQPERWRHRDGAPYTSAYVRALAAYAEIGGDGREVQRRLTEVLAQVSAGDGGLEVARALGRFENGRAVALAYLRRQAAVPDLPKWLLRAIRSAIEELQGS